MSSFALSPHPIHTFCNLNLLAQSRQLMHVYAQMENREQTIASEVAAAIAQSGRSDRFFVNLFGVNQSTVSRLRAGKIKKAHKYRDLLRANGLIGSSSSGLAANQIQELLAVAEQDAALRQLLASLHNFVHKSMQNRS